jgi:hypothetical protein
MAEKTLSADLKTTWTPDLPFNKARPEGDRVSVVIEWPSIEAFDLAVSRNEGTSAMFHRLTRDCCVEIANYKVGGVPVKSGKELVAIRSKGAAASRSLSINIGSYIFEQSILTEDEEKN